MAPVSRTFSGSAQDVSGVPEISTPSSHSAAKSTRPRVSSPARVPARASRTACAKLRSVASWSSNRISGRTWVISTPSEPRTLAISSAARIELPPLSKKLSSGRIRFTFSTCRQIRATARSNRSTGALTKPSSSDLSTAGSAARSTLPLVFSGSSGNETNAVGTM